MSMRSSLSRYVLLLTTIAFLIPLITNSAGAELSCVMKPSCAASEVALLGLYDRTYNTHSGLPGADPNYDYLLCCSDDEVTIGYGDSHSHHATFLLLENVVGESDDHNAHVETADYSGSGFTGEAVIGSDEGEIICDHTGNTGFTCDPGEGYECMAIIYENVPGHGKHVYNCSQHTEDILSGEIKVCCRTGKKSNNEIWFEEPTPQTGPYTGGSLTVNVTVFNESFPINDVWLEWLEDGNPRANESFGDFDRSNSTGHYFFTIGKSGMMGGSTYSFRAHIQDENPEEDIASTEWRDISIDSRISVSLIDPTPVNETLSSIDRVLINASIFNETVEIDTVWTEWAGVNYTMEFDHTNGSHYFHQTEITGLNEGIYWYRVWANDTLSNTAVTEYRMYYYDTLPVGIVINGGSQYTNDYDVLLGLTYEDFTDSDYGYVMYCSYRNETMKWTDWETCGSSGSDPESYTKGWEMYYQEGTRTVGYRVRVSQLYNSAGDSIVLDMTPPVSSIGPQPKLIYNTSLINLSWSGTDPDLDSGEQGSGIHGYLIQYRVMDHTGSYLEGEWQNLSGLPGYAYLDDDGYFTFPGGNEAENLDLLNLADKTELIDIYNYTFLFRSRAVDVAGNLESGEGIGTGAGGVKTDTNITVVIPINVHTWVETDWGPIPIYGGKTVNDLPVKIHAEIISQGTYDVTINHSVHGPEEPKESWIWNVDTCSGIVLGEDCFVEIPGSDEARRVDYYVKAKGVTGTEISPPTVPDFYWHFLMLDHPIAEFMAEKITMLIGTVQRVPVRVSNIQAIDDEFTLRMTGGNFRENAVFTDSDSNELKITLNPQEEEIIYVELRPSETGSGFRLELDAMNSEAAYNPGSSSAITDYDDLTINVVYPANFPGLSLFGMGIVIILSALIFYTITSKEK